MNGRTVSFPPLLGGDGERGAETTHVTNVVILMRAKGQSSGPTGKGFTQAATWVDSNSKFYSLG